MRLPEYFKYGEKGPVISFEIFPPKTEKGMENLGMVIEELTGIGPDFITVTYGVRAGTSIIRRCIVYIAKTGLI